MNLKALHPKYLVSRLSHTWSFIAEMLRRGKWFLAIAGVIAVGAVFPPAVSAIAAFMAAIATFKFGAWVIVENRQEISKVSFWRFVLATLMTPLVAMPGLFLFLLVAGVIFATDLVVTGMLTGLAGNVPSAASAILDFQNSDPSFWDFPKYTAVVLLNKVFPPTATQEAAGFLAYGINLLNAAYSVFGVFVWSLFSIALIRFFMQVWLRLVLMLEGANVSFALMPDSHASAAIEAKASESGKFEYLLADRQSIFVSRQSSPRGIAPRGSSPKLFSALIPRLRYRKWRLRRYTGSKKKSLLTFTASMGSQYIEVALKENQSIAIDMKQLVGFDETVEIKVKWSCKATSLFLGRLAYPVLTGPGTVIILSEGVPDILKDIPEGNFESHRVIAWDVGTRFAVRSSKAFVDLYLEPPYLATEKTGLIVLGPSHGHSGGLFSKLKEWFMRWIVPT